MTVYAASRAGSVERDLSAGRVTERSRLPCFRSGRCRPAASRRGSPAGSERFARELSSLIGELLPWLNANAPGPVGGIHGLLALWLDRAEQNRPRSSADPHCPLGRGHLTRRKNGGRADFGDGGLAPPAASARARRDGGG